MDWEGVWRVLFTLWYYHRGKTLGILLGLIFGLLTVTLGFWKALFIAFCIGVGFWVGKRLDEEGNFKKLLDRILKER